MCIRDRLELDGVFLFVGVGGHDGGGGIGAALLVRSQLCGGGRDAPGKGVDDHGLTDDTGGGGQNVLRVDAQLLAHQLAAFFGQSHAAVSYTHLDVYKRQVPVHL